MGLKYFFFTLVGEQQPENAVMSVLTNNWTDEEETKKIGKVIRDLGIKEELKYKPSLYTHLNIFRDGEFQLCPTVYKIPKEQNKADI